MSKIFRYIERHMSTHQKQHTKNKVYDSFHTEKTVDK